MRKLIARVYDYSLDGLIATEGTAFFQFCRDLPDDPEEDVSAFMAELASVVRGAADLDNFAPVAVLLAQWRHTAEVHADPALLEIVERLNGVKCG